MNLQQEIDLTKYLDALNQRLILSQERLDLQEYILSSVAQNILRDAITQFRNSSHNGASLSVTLTENKFSVTIEKIQSPTTPTIVSDISSRCMDQENVNLHVGRPHSLSSGSK